MMYVKLQNIALCKLLYSRVTGAKTIFKGISPEIEIGFTRYI